MGHGTLGTSTCGDAVRIPKETNAATWERLVCRYLIARGVPNLTYDARKKRFVGIKGFSMVRISPSHEGGWARVPFFFRRYENERSNGNPHPVVMFLTSKHNGDGIEHTFVLTRLEVFTSLLKTAVEANPGYYLGKE